MLLDRAERSFVDRRQLDIVNRVRSRFDRAPQGPPRRALDDLVMRKCCNQRACEVPRTSTPGFLFEEAGEWIELQPWED